MVESALYFFGSLLIGGLLSWAIVNWLPFRPITKAVIYSVLFVTLFTPILWPIMGAGVAVFPVLGVGLLMFWWTPLNYFILAFGISLAVATGHRLFISPHRAEGSRVPPAYLLSACLLVGGAAAAYFSTPSGPQTREGKAPIHSLTVDVPQPLAAAFLDELENFAKTSEFRFRKSGVYPDGSRVVHLKRPEIEIVAVNTFDEERFELRWYAGETRSDRPNPAHTSIAALKSHLAALRGITFLNPEAPQKYVDALKLKGLDGRKAMERMVDLGFKCEIKSEEPRLVPRGEAVPHQRIECTRTKPNLIEDCPQLRVSLFLDYSRFDPDRQQKTPLDDSHVWRTHGRCQVPRA